MSVVRYTVSSLLSSLTTSPTSVEEHLATQLRYRGVSVAEGERRSWRRSLPVLASDLEQAGLGGVEVILEYQLPWTSKRTDVILAGAHPRTGEPSFVVVELKQWSTAHRSAGDSDVLVDPEGARYREVLHPSEQVKGYLEYLRDYLRELADRPQAVQGVAYLHNATDLLVESLFDVPAVKEVPLFTGQRRARFQQHLRALLDPSVPGVEAADLLLSSDRAPSRNLLSVAAEVVKERDMFVLLDEQRVAVDLVHRAVEKSRRGDTKEVVLVTGGPGSGKSVIALTLLGDLARQGRTVLHAGGSRSFTETLRQVVGKGSTRTRKMFLYFNNFMTSGRNELDVLILDEAHRIRETSVDRYTRKEARQSARPQVDELIDAARVPVFLLDEYQVVRPGEIGNVADIRAAAGRKGLTVRQVDLDAQFRAGGSQRYIEWVETLLGLDGPPSGTAEPWPGDPAFEVEAVSSPAEMEARLRLQQDKGWTARITAGFCWPWSKKPGPDGALVRDVVVGDWARPWNVYGDRAVGGAPPAALWATDPAGFDQVGCVYTAQGFEYGWNGVILGPDLVWRGAANGGAGGWVARREHSRDPAFTKRVSDDDYDRLVRNVYKVLLTRGMVGTLLYSTDEETQAMLERVLGRAAPPARR